VNGLNVRQFALVSSASTGAASLRASVLLDAARAALRRVGADGGAGRHPATSAFVARAAERLVWAGSWLDEPYRAREADAPGDGLSRLRELADELEALIESFEDEDPVANANGVQTGSLAFAIVSHAASYLTRLGARS
jgi:hypothetical protein